MKIDRYQKFVGLLLYLSKKYKASYVLFIHKNKRRGYGGFISGYDLHTVNPAFKSILATLKEERKLRISFFSKNLQLTNDSAKKSILINTKFQVLKR